MGVVFLAGCDGSAAKPQGNKPGEAKPKQESGQAQQQQKQGQAQAAQEKDKAPAAEQKPAAVADPFAPVEKASKPSGTPVQLDGPVLPGLEPAAAPSAPPSGVQPVGKK